MADDALTGTIAWVSPSNATGGVNDNIWTEAQNLDNGNITHYLKCTNFGFSMPATDRVDGIIVSVEWHKTGGNIKDQNIYLVKAGIIQTGGNNRGSGANIPDGSDVTNTYGNATDLWNVSLTPADINSSGFGVAFSLNKVGGGATQTARIDRVWITVYHSAGSYKRYSVASGNWNSASIWSETSGGPSGASVPTSTDTVHVGGGFTVTLNTDGDCNRLAVDGGTLDLPNAGGAKTLTAGTGGVFISSTGDITSGNNNAHLITTSGSADIDRVITSVYVTIEMTGDGKNLDGTGTVQKLEIDNGSTVNLQSNLTINTSLTLTSGKINIASGILIIGATATINGVGAGNYIQADGSGFLRKLWTGIGTFVYPVGDAAIYSPFTVTFNAATYALGAYLETRVVNGTHPDFINPPADYISRYWSLAQNGISSPDFNYTGRYNQADDVNGTETNIISTKWNGAGWEQHLPVDDVNNDIRGNNITSFSDFTGGDAVALPITLLYFDAQLKGNIVELEWETATEINNDYFTVEKTYDDIYYEQVEIVKGAGNSNIIIKYSAIDDQPYNGISYYRLKQTDFDGKYQYSGLVSVKYQQSRGILIYPNPVYGDILFIETSEPDNSQINISFYSPLGELINSATISIPKGDLFTKIMLQQNLSPGIYYIIAKSRNDLFHEKLVVK